MTFSLIRLAYLDDLEDEVGDVRGQSISIFKGPARIKEDVLAELKNYMGEAGWTNKIKRAGYDIEHKGEIGTSDNFGLPGIRNNHGLRGASKLWSFPSELAEGDTFTIDFDNRLINTDLNSKY